MLGLKVKNRTLICGTNARMPKCFSYDENMQRLKKLEFRLAPSLSLEESQGMSRNFKQNNRKRFFRNLNDFLT